MATESERDVYRALRDVQTRYAYFLLAAAGAAIALALQETQSSALSWSQLPLAAAVAAWALSFFFGCRHLTYVSFTLYANFVFLQMESGTHSATVGEHPLAVAAASARIKEAADDKAKDAGRFADWQFRALVTGAILYLAWHVVEMYRRTGVPWITTR